MLQQQRKTNFDVMVGFLKDRSADYSVYKRLMTVAGGSIERDGSFRPHYRASLQDKHCDAASMADLNSWFMQNVIPELQASVESGDLYANGITAYPHVDAAGNLQCITCRSRQLHSEKRGYDFWRGGIFGSGQIVVTCLKCGQTFTPGGEPY